MESPAPQGKRKRETIVARSKRIIGKQLPTDPKTQEKTSKDSSSTGDNAKRRAQILKAQRAHRRRTQNYIQELENEVLRLQARETELVEKLEKQSLTNAVLSPPDSAYRGSADLTTTPSTSIAIDVPELDNNEIDPELSRISAPTLITQPQFEIPTHGHDITLLCAGIRDAGHCTGAVCGMDAQTAMDFILGIERSCSPHVQHNSVRDKYSPFQATHFEIGSSHTCPDTDADSVIHSHQHIDLATQKCTMSVADVEALLAKSRSLPLGLDLTPVQVWAILVEISNVKSIANEVWQQLRAELHKCMAFNSFGTTIAIDTLRQVLNYFFPWFSTFQLRAPGLLDATDYNQNMLDPCMGQDWLRHF